MKMYIKILKKEVIKYKYYNSNYRVLWMNHPVLFNDYIPRIIVNLILLYYIIVIFKIVFFFLN